MPDRVCLITGASSGIGAATARFIARPGLGLFLHARGGPGGEKRPALEKLAADLRLAGADVDIHFSDLAEGGGADLVTACVTRFGQLDQIVSNAGFALSTPIGELSRDDFERSMETITGALFDIMTASLPHLEQSSCGRLVAVSSFVARHAPGGRIFPATAAAKGGMEALVRAFAVQLAGQGVTVNAVAPGFTRKEVSGHSALPDKAWQEAADLTPMRKLAEPRDIAAAIAFFLSDDAGHITGQTLHVDGGLTLN